MNTITSPSTSQSILDVANMGAIMKFAEVMATGVSTVPNHLRGNTADCLAVTMQAMQWGMSPFAVAQKTHLVNGLLGYESQLVNAVISSSRAIRGRFKYEQVGNWETWSLGNKTSEKGLGVKVGAVIDGEEAITWGQTVFINTVTIRNSPLWKTQPYQQMCYLALKYWARLYTPDVILGVYDREEMEPVHREEKVINPSARRGAHELNEMFSTKKVIEEKSEPSIFVQMVDLAKKVNDQQGYEEVREMYTQNRDDLTRDQKVEISVLMNSIKSDIGLAG